MRPAAPRYDGVDGLAVRVAGTGSPVSRPHWMELEKRMTPVPFAFSLCISRPLCISLKGILNTMPADWLTGPAKRPGSANGRELNEICVTSVCPSQAGKILKAADALKTNPGIFNLFANNCANNGCKLLQAGGVNTGNFYEIPNTPQNLLNCVAANNPSYCFMGYTLINQRTGNASAFPEQHGPKVTLPDPNWPWPIKKLPATRPVKPR